MPRVRIPMKAAPLTTFLSLASDAILPEEITKELESMVDDARKSRIERLEKLRRREDVLPGEDDDDDELKSDQPISLHESAESSVEGEYRITYLAQ